MNFDWTAEDKEIKSKLAALFDKASLLELEQMEDADTETLKRITVRHLGRLAEAGYLGLGLSSADRSRMMTLIAAQEELARLSGSLFLTVEASARLFCGLLESFGDPSSLGEILGPCSKGEIIGAVAVSEYEPIESSPVGATEAVYDGTDYVITGRKSYVTNGPIADWIAVSAEVEGKPAFLLVENGQRGVDLGPRLKTLGYNGLAVSSLELNHARVPRGHVLGPFDDRSVLMFLVQTQDLILTVAGLGVMERAVAAAKDYAESHSRGRKPVSRFQETRFKLAEMLTLLQTAQLLTYRAGWLYRASDPEAATVILCAKVFGSEASEQVSTLAMQIMAGRGYISGNPVERAYRDAKFAALAGTTSEIARMSIAADLLTRHKV